MTTAVQYPVGTFRNYRGTHYTPMAHLEPSMSKYKGSGLMVIHKFLSPEVRSVFHASMSAEEHKAFDWVLATAWVPLETAAGIFSKAAAAANPPDPERGLVDLGHFQARENLTGIYRPLLRMATVNFAIQQAARFWGSYFDAGRARAERKNDHRAEFIVEAFPDLPRPNRLIVGGYIVGLLEMTRVTDIHVAPRDDDPLAWRWDISWR